MGRLRKDYLTRQRSAQFKCLAYTFLHRHCLLERVLPPTGCSCQLGMERSILKQSRLAAPMLLCYNVGGAHSLLVSSLLPTLLFPLMWEDPPIRAEQVLIILFFWRTIWSFPFLLGYEQLCWCSWPEESDPSSDCLAALLFPLISSMLPKEV